MKRIYNQSIKKWALKAGIPVGIVSFSLLFIYLSMLGAIEITGHSNDIVCAGSELDPCISYVNFTANEDIFIYPMEYDPWGRNTPFETDKGLKSWKMYRSWGKGWREIDLSKTCVSTWCGAPPNSPDNKYSFAFREDRNYQIKIVALKINPTEDIKWTFGPLDPTWFGIEDGLRYSVDKKIGIISNDSNDLAKVSLLTPKVNYVMRGKDRKVMVWEIENYGDSYVDGIDMDIYNLKNNKKEDKNYHLEYAIYETIDVEDKKESCVSKGIGTNGTSLGKTCTWDVTGTHKETRIKEWKLMKDIPKGNITIALVTDVSPGDSYDAIPTIIGKRFNEWAEWTDSLNIDLISYFQLNEDSGSNAFNIVNPLFNGTMIGMEGDEWYDGIIGNGIWFDVNTEYFNVSSEVLNNVSNFTINFWMNSTNFQSGNEILIHNWFNGGSGDQFQFSFPSEGYINFFTIMGGSQKQAGPSFIIVGDEWFMMTGRYNGTGITLFINGSYIASESGYSNAMFTSERDMSVGHGGGSGNHFEGMIDELGIWNRSLSNSEILDLYNNGTGITFKPTLFSPVVTLNSPLNNTIIATSLVTFNCSAVDDQNVTNMSLWVNGFENFTLSLGSSNTSSLETIVTGFQRGIYNWTCNAYDNLNHLSWAPTNFTFNITRPYGNTSITLEGSTSNLNSELGSPINISVNQTDETRFGCVDIPDFRYGVNYSCALGNSSFDFNISYFRGNELNDTSTLKNISWIDGGNNTVYLQAHQYDEIINFSINVSGFETNDTFPTAVKIYINNILSNSLGLLFNGVIILKETNKSQTEENLTYSTVETKTSFLRIPKNALVSSAIMNLSGDLVYTINPNLDPSGFTSIVPSTSEICQEFTAYSNYTKNITFNFLTITEGCAGSNVPAHYTYGIKTSVGGGFVSGTCVDNFLTEPKSCEVNFTSTPGNKYWGCFQGNTSGHCIKLQGRGEDVYANHQSSIAETKSDVDIDFVVNSRDWTVSPFLEVGFLDGNYEWNYTGYFNVTNNITLDFSSQINTTLSTCTQDDNGFCDIPLYLGANGYGGIITINDIQISYTSNPNPVFLNRDLILSFLGSSTGFADIPIKFESTRNGTLTINDIRFDYAGGNKTYEILSHNADYTFNKSLNLTFFYSTWDFIFPRFIDFFEFIPNFPTAVNVSPYGQTRSTPIFNITFYNYGGRTANQFFYLNETMSCVDLYISQNSTKPSSSLWDGLIGHWPFDIDARDVSGNGFNGTVSGAIFNESGGQMGGAYEFFADELITIDTFNATKFTITSWVYIKGNDSSDAMGIVWKESDFGMRVTKASGLLSCYSHDGSYDVLNSVNRLSLNEWNFVSCSYNGTNMTNYINGVIESSETQDQKTNSSDNIKIGQQDNSRAWNGTIDEVRIYNRSLSSSEIYQLYNRSFNKYFDQKLSPNWKATQWNSEYLNNTKYFVWADYSCNFTNWHLFNPDIYVRTCAFDIDVCSEELI